jgi:hypothetical protein
MILLIDVEDEFGIIQHLTFEGDNDIKYAEEELYDIRKTRKLKGESELQSLDKLQLPEPKLYWKCPRCLRQNAMKAKFCTHCGFEKPEKTDTRKE